ncbi:acetyltransferase [Seminavis robusta]|uniref:Acetyltransferase n=1 Tax=Seminavis robusta TaxID=568900 RepID=A0A9N8HTW4_9STRA|nr:acetyltransferase [Seminavis robusta]|eukprot:Sro1559_g282480.1 acetyltransferase (202) ;mRNA; f:16937-17542
MKQVHSLLSDPKGDVAAIRELFKETFGASEGPNEGQLIGTLAENMIQQTPENDLHVFVTKLHEDDSGNSTGGALAGCIIFSRMTFSSQPETGAMLLGPVGVLPAHQKQGIGKGLIQFGLKNLQEDTSNKGKLDLAMVYGDPKYYSKVANFIPVNCETIPAPFKLSQPQGWQALSLTGQEDEIKAIQGTSSCVEAMSKPELW